MSFWPEMNCQVWIRWDIIMTNQITKDIVIFYHAECSDGFGGAWAAWKKFGEEADYIVFNHNDSLSENLKDKQIFFIDILPGNEMEIKKVVNDNKSVVAIDHHKTNESKISLFKEYSFDNNHSGAVLAWRYFHPDKPVPKLLLFIEDVDIWKWEYPETDKFTSALALYDFDFEIWDKIASDVENEKELNKYLSKGEVVSKYSEKIMDWLSQTAILAEFEYHKVYVVNAPDFIKGRVANKLAEKLPPFAIAWVQEKDTIFVSLRSGKNDFDVSEIAEKYGGGGHKAASGFSFPAGQPFPWKIIK